MRAIWASVVCLVIIVTVSNHSYFCEAASLGPLLEPSIHVSNETLSNGTDLSAPNQPIAVVAALSKDDVTAVDGIADTKLRANHDDHDDDDDDDDDHDHREHDDDDDDDDDDKKKKIKKVLKKKSKGGVPTVLSITETIVDGNVTTKRPCPLGHRPTFGGNSSLELGSNVTAAEKLGQGTALEKIGESIVGALSSIKNSVTSIFVPGTGLPNGGDGDLDCVHNDTLASNSTGNSTSLPVSMGEGSSGNLTVPVDLNVTTTTELPSGNITTTLPSVADGGMGNGTTTSPGTSTPVPTEIGGSTTTVATTSEAPVVAGP